MVIKFPGFAGPSYVSQSPLAANERTVNLYQEVLEIAHGKARIVLYGTPGLEHYVTLGDGPVRAVFEQDGRTFAVSGDRFDELFGPDLSIQRGTVAIDTRSASIFSNGLNGNQIGIVSGGLVYTFNLSTNTFAVVSDADVPANVVMGDHMDGYAILLTQSGVLRISSLNNFTAYDAIDAGTRSQGSDTFTAMRIDPPYVWLWGPKTGEVWENTGTADFPFAPVSGVFIPMGIDAPFSPVPLSAGMAWVGGGRMGGRTVWLAPQFIPQPISTPAVSRALESYPASVIAGAIGWREQVEGHEWYVLTFPDVATWVYDVTDSAKAQQPIWHERARYVNGVEEAHLARCHSATAGLHLVGSRVDGEVYRQHPGAYRYGTEVRRCLRRPPRVSEENARIFHRMLHLEAEVGEGPSTVELRWSDDGGKTFSNVHSASTGAVGEYRNRVQWLRLGQSRDRVYEFVTTDNAKVAWLDAYIELQRGAA